MVLFLSVLPLPSNPSSRHLLRPPFAVVLFRLFVSKFIITSFAPLDQGKVTHYHQAYGLDMIPPWPNPKQIQSHIPIPSQRVLRETRMVTLVAALQPSIVHIACSLLYVWHMCETRRLTQIVLR